MIRLSTEKDIEGIIRLWSEAFGDSEEEIQFFLNNRYEADNTLVYEIDGEIASMLFLLEGDMSVMNTDYPSYYLYAACTLKKFRGRGLMAELLAFAKAIAADRNKYFICLKPGEKSLFDFYEKHGYKTVFKVMKCNFNLSDFDKNCATVFSNLPFDSYMLRNEAYKGHCFFKWDKPAIDFAFLHNRYFGGNSAQNCKGYALYTVNCDEITVKETTFTTSDLLLRAIYNEGFDESKPITVCFPPWVNEIGEITDSAMLIGVNDSAEKIAAQIDNAYLGLTLE